MKFIKLHSTDPYLNLAIEEYLFRCCDDDIFMLWQNCPSVIIGKNQNAYTEVDLEYLKLKGIKLARRITGGGAVYHDMGNLNFSYIAKKEDKEIDFTSFSKPIIDVLKTFIDKISLSGRNDILLGDKKISGNAQYANGKRVLHHGTLLFDSSLEDMSCALLVDREKVLSKGISSVRSRVVNLKASLPNLSIDALKSAIEAHIIKSFDAKLCLAPENEIIESLYKRNSSSEWILSDKSFLINYNVKKEKRYPFGRVCVFLELERENIKRAKISGDFFELADSSELEDILCSKRISELSDAISTVDVSDYISGMSNEQFLELLK